MLRPTLIKKTNLKNNKDIQSNNKVITTHPELILTTSHSMKQIKSPVILSFEIKF